jgi:hypothetical protein
VPKWTGRTRDGYHVTGWAGKVHRHRVEGFLGEKVVAKVAVDLGRGDAGVSHDLGKQFDTEPPPRTNCDANVWRVDWYQVILGSLQAARIAFRVPMESTINRRPFGSREMPTIPPARTRRSAT